MASKGMPVLRILLILSAIDLLCSALTAGLVLFVILVGGDAGSVQAAASSGSGSGLNEIIAVDSSGKVQLFGPAEITKQGTGNLARAPSDSREKVFFKNNPTVLRRIYLVPSRYSKISVIGASSFELIVRPVIGPSMRLFVRCVDGVPPLEFSLDPLKFPECNVGDPAGALAFPNMSTILVPSKNNSFTSELPSSSPFVRKYTVSNAFTIPENLAVWGFEE